MVEVWKDIKGYEGLYQISNLARVRSFDRKTNHRYGGKRLLPGRMLKLKKYTNGYVGVELYDENRDRKGLNLHRTIAIAFIPNPENKPQINHKNGIKDDNRVENLEWCTASENQKHSYRLGLNKGPHGEKNGKCKLTENEVRAIRLIDFSEITKAKIGRIYGVDRTGITGIIKRKTWTYI